jgi:phospholipid/cholesterol/gamma-HCH transport system substrate-binding protein
MKHRRQQVRLGIFVFFSILLLAVLVIFFAANRLFEKTDTYYVSYQDVSVSGLEVGSPVEYLGIGIGSISGISINPKDINSIIVELSVQAGTPIKKDVRADIVSMGITGLKAIEIRGGSNQASLLSEGEFIHAGASTAEEITGRANVIAEKAEKVINHLQIFTDPENMDRIMTAIDEISRLAGQLQGTVLAIDTVIRENRSGLRETIGTARNIAQKLDTSSRTLNEALGSINRIVQGDTLNMILSNAHDISSQVRQADLKTLIENLAEVSEQTRILLSRIDQEMDMNSREFNESINLLRVTLSNLEEASAKINSDPSLLLRGPGDKDIPDKRLNR